MPPKKGLGAGIKNTPSSTSFTTVQKKSSLAPQGKSQSSTPAGVLPPTQTATPKKETPPPTSSIPNESTILGSVVFWNDIQAVVKFYGPTFLSSGHMVGLELSEPVGHHDGEVDGTRYFTCPKNTGVLVPLESIVTGAHQVAPSTPAVVVGGVSSLLQNTRSHRLRSLGPVPTASPSFDDNIAPWSSRTFEEGPSCISQARKEESTALYFYSTTHNGTSSTMHSMHQQPATQRDMFCDDLRAPYKEFSYGECQTMWIDFPRCEMGTQWEEGMTHESSHVDPTCETLPCDVALLNASMAYEEAVKMYEEMHKVQYGKIHKTSQVLLEALGRCVVPATFVGVQGVLPSDQSIIDTTTNSTCGDVKLAAAVESMRTCPHTATKVGGSSSPSKSGNEYQSVLNTLERVSRLAPLPEGVSDIMCKAVQTLVNLTTAVPPEEKFTKTEFDEYSRRIQFEEERLIMEQESAHEEGNTQAAYTLFLSRKSLNESYQSKCVERRDAVQQSMKELTTFKETLKREFIFSAKSLTLHSNDVSESLDALKKAVHKLAQEEKQLIQTHCVNLSHHSAFVQEVRDTMIEEDSLNALKPGGCSTIDCLIQTMNRRVEVARQVSEAYRITSDRATEHNIRMKDIASQQSEYLKNIRILEKVVEAVSACRQTFGVIESLSLSSCKQQEAALWGLLTQTHTDNLKVFRSLMLSTGEMIFRKNRALREIESRLMDVEGRYLEACDSFDTNAKVLAQERDSLLQDRHELQSTLQNLENSVALSSKGFDPTAQALLAMGREFTDPREEVKLIDAQRSQKLLAYYSLVNRKDDVIEE